jgi:O-antigen ligase
MLGEDRPLAVLVLFLLLALFTGGSSRDDATALILLRPATILFLGIALFELRAAEIRAFRLPLVLAGSWIAVALLQLVPLPPGMWAALPGHDLAAENARLAGSLDRWRPLNLVPWRGWNAVFALTVPVTALLLAIRLDERQRSTLVPIMLAIGLVSAFVSLLQACGIGGQALYLYAVTNPDAPSGLLANRNHQAVLIACLLPMLAVVAAPHHEASRLMLRAILAIATGLILWLLLLVLGSRSGFLLGIVAIPIVILIVRIGADGLLQGRWAKLGATIVAVIALTVGILALPRATALNRLIDTDQRDDVRVQVWKPVTGLVRDYMPFGSGFGSFMEVYQAGEPRELLAPTYMNHAHNDLLELALEGGLPVVALVAAGVVAWIVRLARVLRFRRGRVYDRRVAVLGSAILLLEGLASAVDYPLRVPFLACLLAVSIVWMSAPVPISGRRRSSSTSSNPDRARLAQIFGVSE